MKSMIESAYFYWLWIHWAQLSDSQMPRSSAESKYHESSLYLVGGVFAKYLSLKKMKEFELCSMLRQDLLEMTIYAQFPSPEASHYPYQVGTVANLIGERPVLDASQWQTFNITLARLVMRYCRLDASLEKSRSKSCHYWSRGFLRFCSFFCCLTFMAQTCFRTDALIQGQ